MLQTHKVVDLILFKEGISFRTCQSCQGENKQGKNLMGIYLTIWNYNM